MHLIVVRESTESSADGGVNLLRYALSTNPLASAVREGVDYLWLHGRGSDAIDSMKPTDSQWVLPSTWRTDLPSNSSTTVAADEFRSSRAPESQMQHSDSWVVVADGRFAACLNQALLMRAVAAMNADVIAVDATPDLLAYRERVRLTPTNQLVGFRRLFADSAVRIPMPARWPHRLLVRPDVFETVVRPNLLGQFDTVLEQCRARGLRMQAVSIAGAAFDLESEEGILAVCAAGRDRSDPCEGSRHAGSQEETTRHEGDSPRFIGPVLCGERVVVEPGAVVVGPTVLCDDSVIGRDAVVDSSIVGSGVCVDAGRVVRGRLTLAPGQGRADDQPEPTWKGPGSWTQVCAPADSAFRFWPRFSYVRCFKRVFDVLAAALVLILFAPVFPVIALAVRMSSAGPVFFKDKRQGFHGKSFDCIKFRTMRQGADKIQDKLRFVCEVDGPQFKMADDPRITTVGRFLRETYLDEIPQFFNVLCGQMSVVGPRPSPESENTLCPSWRDARLSVRPGITGLWQVMRTRAEHQDFQEWIRFDTQYVRDLSPRLDLWICWRTFRRMVENFVNQF